MHLPFRITNCRFLLVTVVRTWGLVYINLSFAWREFVWVRDCVRTVTSFSHFIRSLVLRREDYIFCEPVVVLALHAVHVGCFCCRAILKACSAASAANQKPFVNKKLSTRKSAKTNCEEVRAKHLASAWQHKMSGSSNASRFSETLLRSDTNSTSGRRYWQLTFLKTKFPQHPRKCFKNVSGP